MTEAERNRLIKARIRAIQTRNVVALQNIERMLNRPQAVNNYQEPTFSTVNYQPFGETETGSKNMAQHPMVSYLTNQKQMLLNQAAQRQSELDNEAGLLQQAESKARGGYIPNNGPGSLRKNLALGLDDVLMPGNLGDLNRVVWPFWFTSTKATLAPNSSVSANVTVTQEAAFIWIAYQKTVLEESVGFPGQYEYIDPDQPGASGKSNNLTMIMRDSQSSRQFMNRNLDINEVGHWLYPSVLPTPQLFLPNSNIEINFANNDNTATYRPYITLFGYRVRIEYAKDILSLVNG